MANRSFNAIGENFGISNIIFGTVCMVKRLLMVVRTAPVAQIEHPNSSPEVMDSSPTSGRISALVTLQFVSGWVQMVESCRAMADRHLLFSRAIM